MESFEPKEGNIIDRSPINSEPVLIITRLAHAEPARIIGDFEGEEFASQNCDS